MARTKVAKKAAAGIRFVVNKDNTVTDRKTELLIIQDPTLLGDAFKNIMSWDAANKVIEELNAKGYAGHKDWRMPTVEELVGMTDRTKCNPCYDTNIFKGEFSDWYWTREECVWRKDAAWCVVSGYGNVSNSDKDLRNYVRPVRSSQCQFDHLSRR